MTPPQSSAVESEAPKESFRFKGGLFPFTQLEVYRFERKEFAADLRDKVAQSPAFFLRMPVILTIHGEHENPRLLNEIIDTCRKNDLLPAALRTDNPEFCRQAEALELAVIPAARVKPAAVKTETAADEVPEHPSADPAAAATQASPRPASGNRVITAPVRSGQQVYAAGGDLIVLSSVSTGAEVLADGNIHIYGALRGRALAGVQGDASARIFCHSLEAELISVAGDFKLDEDFRTEWWKKPVQISLEERVLCIRPLT